MSSKEKNGLSVLLMVTVSLSLFVLFLGLLGIGEDFLVTGLLFLLLTPFLSLIYILVLYIKKGEWWFSALTLLVLFILSFNIFLNML